MRWGYCCAQSCPLETYRLRHSSRVALKTDKVSIRFSPAIAAHDDRSPTQVSSFYYPVHLGESRGSALATCLSQLFLCRVLVPNRKTLPNPSAASPSKAHRYTSCA